MTFQDNQRMEVILIWPEHNYGDIILQIKKDML